MQRNAAVIVLALAAILSIAILGTACMREDKSAPQVSHDLKDKSAPQVSHDESAAQAACLERGGMWHSGFYEGDGHWKRGSCMGGK